MFCFCSNCLNIEDLSEANILDRFLHALVLDVWMQVELRGPLAFHEAAMYAERADAILSQVFGQDSNKNWQKHQKGRVQQRPMPPMKTAGESSMGSSAGLEPMELGAMRRKKLSKEE